MAIRFEPGIYRCNKHGGLTWEEDPSEVTPVTLIYDNGEEEVIYGGEAYVSANR
ncbi:MAG: hypothetical protein LBV23_00570 [Deltaproteobacteria bacterium]|jgi:hypothetical protein|nr:hypothetical protein [Deltaproteobacteria bacterium]